MSHLTVIINPLVFTVILTAHRICDAYFLNRSDLHTHGAIFFSLCSLTSYIKQKMQYNIGYLCKLFNLQKYERIKNSFSKHLKMFLEVL